MIGKVFPVTTSAFTKAKLKGFEFTSSNMKGTRKLSPNNYDQIFWAEGGSFSVKF